MEVLEDMVKSCYIHIPFCNKICNYCDFCKVLYDKRFISKYLKKKKKEIDHLYKGEELETLYIVSTIFLIYLLLVLLFSLGSSYL